MSRRLRHVQRVDPLGPPLVRQQASQGGPTAVMRSQWRDPDDLRPNAQHRPREIDGYRTYCPLRRMSRSPGSQITPRHIAAADLLRSAVDMAVIGSQGGYGLLGLGGLYGPLAGPSVGALRQSAAQREACRALTRLAPSQRALLTAIVLFNHSLQAWCAETTGRNPQVEMGRLLGVLDVLADHYAGELDQQRASGQWDGVSS
jgi:hypothetical protein